MRTLSGLAKLALVAVGHHPTGTPVGVPAVDFGGAFETRKSYLTTARIFENKVVAAITY